MRKYKILLLILFGGTLALSAQSLEDYLQIAAENNPGLQAKYKEFEAALQKVPQVNSLPDPSLSFGYFISPVETRVGPQRVKFSLSQMFPWFGTLKLQGDVAALMAEVKYQEFLDAQNKLYFQVSNAYYPLYEVYQWQEIEQRNIEILKSYKTIANSKFKNAAGPMVDVLRVDIMLSDASTNLSILEQKQKPLQSTFNKLLNRNEDEEIILDDSMKMGGFSEFYRKDSLLSDNPVLNALDLKIEAGQTSVEVARKQGLPKIGLGLDYVIVGERTDAVMADNGKDVLMPMLSMSIPIYRKKYNASVKEAQFMQESYSLQKSEYINSLTSGYEMAGFDVNQQRELYLLYNQNIEESNQMLSLLLASYSNSGKDFTEVLRMQQQVLKYQKMKASAITQFYIAIAKINYLTAKSYQNEN